jgi:hypothetical protein
MKKWRFGEMTRRKTGGNSIAKLARKEAQNVQNPAPILLQVLLLPHTHQQVAGGMMEGHGQ